MLKKTGNRGCARLPNGTGSEFRDLQVDITIDLF